MEVPPISFQNKDNDQAEILISDLQNSSTEEGDNASFFVKLATKPQGEVILKINNDDPEEGTVDPTILQFDASNWEVIQKVMIAGKGR